MFNSNHHHPRVTAAVRQVTTSSAEPSKTTNAALLGCPNLEQTRAMELFVSFLMVNIPKESKKRDNAMVSLGKL
jgi:hypothetical protein